MTNSGNPYMSPSAVRHGFRQNKLLEPDLTNQASIFKHFAGNGFVKKIAGAWILGSWHIPCLSAVLHVNNIYKEGLDISTFI